MDSREKLIEEYGTWILGLHYDRDVKAYRRYDLNNIVDGDLKLEFEDKLYDKDGNIIRN